VRLDHLLKRLFPQESRTTLQLWITAGHVAYQGKILRKPSLDLPEEALLEVTPWTKPSLLLQPESMEIHVVYEDLHCLVIDKPAGRVVHPGAGHATGTLVNGLLGYSSHLSSLSGIERPGIVHRLDKDTSGLLVIAKHDQAHRALAEQFLNKKTIQRTYRALVLGHPSPSKGTLETCFGRHPRDRQKFAVLPQGKKAITHYTVLKTMIFANRLCSALEIILDTGRTHQIRVHMAHVGCPLLGDSVYGSSASLQCSKAIGLHRQALHAIRLSFLHPMSREHMTFESLWPSDLASLVSFE